MCLLLLPGPIISVAVVLGALFVLATASYFVVQFRTFAGYRAVAPELRRLAAGLRSSDIRREGADVIVSGSYGKFPVTVRFSNDEHSPGVRLELRAPISMSLSLYPKAAEAGPGRMQLRTGDPQLDNRFVLRSDAPMTAKLLLEPRSLALIKSVCCSSQTRMAFRLGSIEHLEMLIPADPAEHLSDHLRSLAALAELAAQLPGSEAVKVPPLPRRRLSPILTLSVGCLVLLIGWIVLMSRRDSEPAATVTESAPVTVPAFMGWQVADAGAFDDEFAGWLVRSKVPAVGRNVLRNKDDAKAEVYLLTAADGARRVVIIKGDSTLYDSYFPHLAGMARVPQDEMASVEWSRTGTPAQPSESDGMLLVRDARNPATGVILFLSGGRVVSGTPLDYQRVRVGGVEP